MENMLFTKGIILQSGEVNKDKVNLVAGAITQPFAEMIWLTTGGDMETVNRLTDVLVTMNTPTDRGKLFKIIKMLYGLMGLQFSEEAEAVFRVERNKGYTVMSNHHLRNKELTLKAKGLLSQMLSLPEDWDYTLAGLSLINREKIDAIREAVRELERAGYILRSRERDEKGCLRGTDYVIYEQPQPPIPYTAQMIATITRHQVGTVERALQIYLQLGLVEALDDGTYYMSNLELLIGQSFTEGERKRRARQEVRRQKALCGQMSGSIVDICPPEIEIEKEKEKERVRSRTDRPRRLWQI